MFNQKRESQEGNLESVKDILREKPSEVAKHDTGNVINKLYARSVEERPENVSEQEWYDRVIENVGGWQESMQESLGKAPFSHMTDQSPGIPGVEDELQHIGSVYESVNDLIHVQDGKLSEDYVNPFSLHYEVDSEDLPDVNIPLFGYVAVAEVINNSHFRNNEVQAVNEPDLPKYNENYSSFVITDNGEGLNVDTFADNMTYDASELGGMGLPLLGYIDQNTEMAVKYLLSPEEKEKIWSKISDPKEEMLDHVATKPNSLGDGVLEGCSWYFEVPPASTSHQSYDKEGNPSITH